MERNAATKPPALGGAALCDLVVMLKNGHDASRFHLSRSPFLYRLGTDEKCDIRFLHKAAPDKPFGVLPVHALLFFGPSEMYLMPFDAAAAATLTVADEHSSSPQETHAREATKIALNQCFTMGPILMRVAAPETQGNTTAPPQQQPTEAAAEGAHTCAAALPTPPSTHPLRPKSSLMALKMLQQLSGSQQQPPPLSQQQSQQSQQAAEQQHTPAPKDEAELSGAEASSQASQQSQQEVDYGVILLPTPPSQLQQIPQPPAADTPTPPAGIPQAASQQQRPQIRADGSGCRTKSEAGTDSRGHGESASEDERHHSSSSHTTAEAAATGGSSAHAHRPGRGIKAEDDKQDDEGGDDEDERPPPKKRARSRPRARVTSPNKRRTTARVSSSETKACEEGLKLFLRATRRDHIDQDELESKVSKIKHSPFCRTRSGKIVSHACC